MSSGSGVKLNATVDVADHPAVLAWQRLRPDNKVPEAVETLKEAREAVERELTQDALRRHGGSITAAALELGISRPTLYELMEKLGISRNA